MKFGLWVELEMVNKDSNLYREHPDWIIAAPGRNPPTEDINMCLTSPEKEVVDYIYQMIARILEEAKVSHIKWDMNRSITECYSAALPADRQGESIS